MRLVARVQNSVLQLYFLSRGIMPAHFFSSVCKKLLLLHQSDIHLYFLCFSLMQCFCSWTERLWMWTGTGRRCRISCCSIKMLVFLLTLTCTEADHIQRVLEPLTPQYRTDSLVSCSEICWSSCRLNYDVPWEQLQDDVSAATGRRVPSITLQQIC